MTSFTVAWTVAIFWTKMKICFCVAVFVEWTCFMDYGVMSNEREKKKKTSNYFCVKKMCPCSQETNCKIKSILYV